MIEAVRATVHEIAPHSKAAIYLLALSAATISIAFVFIRCQYESNGRHLESGWLVRTAACAAPIPIYFMLIVAPLDPDVVPALMEDQLVVAIAGFYGLVETIKDIRFTGRRRKTD